jgi:hypothetical protein
MLEYSLHPTRSLRRSYQKPEHSARQQDTSQTEGINQMVDPADQVFPTESHVAMKGGIELRTWIATQTMAALIAANNSETFAHDAANAVHAADALIEELNK